MHSAFYLFYVKGMYTLETLDFGFYIGSRTTLLHFDLYLNNAYLLFK